MTIDFYETGMDAFEKGHYEQARDFFEKGLEDARCHFALGTMFYNGQGVERSFKLSTQHYAIAAEAGIVPAQVSAGFAYANAMGVPEDFDRAAYFLKMAVAQGEAAAKVTLAEIYAMGHAGGSREEAAKLLRDVLSYSSSEEAMDVFNKYELHKV
jgi:hypothetical protein